MSGKIKSNESESSYSRRSAYGGYGSGYGNYGQRSSYGSRSTYGGDGYEGDFWDSSRSRGRGLYSSDDGYAPDPVPSYTQSSYSASSTPQKTFSAASGFASTQSKLKSGAKNYYVGCKVRHPKFGTGTVIALKNGGSVVNVAFENQGIKELSAAIAPLEIL
ncbi:MAG: hypothetical protein K2J54_02875 [Clostridia bacterium]|nr:hypothetical protein [Clostridia bacterium]